MIAASEYLDFLEHEYLADFVARGGAAVKFLVVPGKREGVHDGLEAAARRNGYVYARALSEHARVHMIDQLFFEIARQVDWDTLARRFVGGALDRLRVPPRDPDDMHLTALAHQYGFDAAELARDVRRELQRAVLEDVEMAREFGIAMLRLCQAVLDGGDAAQADRDAVLDWLSGELRLVSKIRRVGIFQRIGRHNARHMLLSLTRWLTRTGHAGLLLDIDLARCAVVKKPPIDERYGTYYSKAAVMDAYEVLRQLVDATDELSSCCVAVVAGPDFLADDRRGLASYAALQLRILDEVRDRTRTNPYASLVRIGGGP